ncbi:hypothetical protein [Zoogloea sp.]|uniref:hypothetical protein n=1 Tax=Zoogloea sp. TaxID=49181 RepID=UPI002632B2CC|nr:hypothetical protein [Zoogloea sp.]MDD3353093.1 hypothetical protein [Zoogloea sp.]
MLVRMDVRKFALVLCALTFIAVGVVVYFQSASGAPEPARKGVAERVETRFGGVLRALGVASVGVDQRSEDVVVVFTQGGRLNRPLAARLPGLAGPDGCGEIDVGVDVGEKVSVWGGVDAPLFERRLECVLGAVVENAARLSQPLSPR